MKHRKTVTPVSWRRILLINHAGCKRARSLLQQVLIAHFQVFRVARAAEDKQARTQASVELIARRSRAELAALRLQLSHARAECSARAGQIVALQTELDDVKAAAANTENVLRARLEAEMLWKQKFVPELHAANASRFAAEEALYRANLPPLRM